MNQCGGFPLLTPKCPHPVDQSPSSHKVADLRKRWQKDVIEMKPDLLSVLIGVNDVGKNLDGVNIKTWEAD